MKRGGGPLKAAGAQRRKGRASTVGSEASPNTTRGREVVVVVGLLALFLVTQYPHAFTSPFVNDDYFFLERTRSASFPSLWQHHDLLFGWYRPWSRELHFWVLQGAFGTAELPFHIASFVLWLAMMTLYFSWVRRVAGLVAAGIATAGLASLALWGAPLLWVAGSQDLWALLFSVAFLHLLTSGRRIAAAITLVLALLSKESAAVLPAIATAYVLLVQRASARQAWLRTWPLWLLTLAWAVTHPTLGARLFGPLRTSMETEHRLPLVEAGIRILLAQFNIDSWPRPTEHAVQALIQGAIGAAILALPVWRIGQREKPGNPKPPRARLLVFGILWALAGWSVLFLPSIGWHAYYGVMGSLGAWLALGIVMSSRPRWVAPILVALALLRSAQALTLSWDWGSEWYQHRAGNLLRVIRQDLLRAHPALPPHSRVFFARIPNNIGLLAGDGPSLRVWYGDGTLSGQFYSQYAPRTAAQARGADYFFVFDSTSGLKEVHPGPEDVPAAREANPGWEHDHDMLAQLFVRSGELRAAVGEYAKLARLPERWDADAYAGVCLQALRDTSAAESCYRRVAQYLGYPVDAVRDSAQALLGRRMVADSPE